jgi:Zn-dependent peptidase ImmA (M78 family)/RNA polymerase subunit RPABC4/transcription elongation factor Spt4
MVYLFLLENKITRLPIDPYDLLTKNKITLRTYRYYAKKHNISVKDIIDAYGSEDAFTAYKGNIHSIAYNDSIKSKGRILFTLMHEIAHIYLKHLEEFDKTIISRGGLSEKEYKALEDEANLFAGEILSPSPVLLSMKSVSISFLQKHCGLSVQAAKVRINQIIEKKSSLSKTYTSRILNIFYGYMYTKTCNLCNYTYYSKEARYCPICGNKKLLWEDGKMRYNDGYELDPEGRALMCPKCGNSELGEGGYCIICGTYIVNRCINENECGTIAPGNARYCSICGAETTFFQDQWLAPWNVVKENMEFEQEVATNKDILEHEFFPAEDEDDLPF